MPHSPLDQEAPMSDAILKADHVTKHGGGASAGTWQGPRLRGCQSAGAQPCRVRRWMGRLQ
jgi:hypothetical protein